MSVKIGALWQKKSDSGVNYLSGVLQDMRGDIQIVAFENDNKTSENAPDYNIFRNSPQSNKGTKTSKSKSKKNGDDEEPF